MCPIPATDRRIGAGGPRFSTTSHNRSDRPILLALFDPAAVNGRLRHFRGPLRADRMTVTRRSASGGASPSGRYQFGEVAEPVLGREVRPSLLGLPGIAGRGRRRQFFEEGLKPGRGYHLNCSRQLVAGIPERVSDSTRFEQIASLGRFELPSATRTPIVPAAT